MKIISNDKLIKRNATIGQVTSLSSLVILGIGMYISFKSPEYFNISIGALLVGFILSQVGIYFGNRWGRRPSTASPSLRCPTLRATRRSWPRAFTGGGRRCGCCGRSCGRQW